MGEMMFTRASSLLIALAMQASEAIQSPCSGPVSMKRKKSEKQFNAKRNKETMNKETMSKEEQMKHEYNELSDDIQSMAFVVSARRVLVVLWFALLVSSGVSSQATAPKEDTLETDALPLSSETSTYFPPWRRRLPVGLDP